MPVNVSVIHSQEAFNQYVYKVIPGECTPGLRVPFVEDLLNSNPCRMWAEFQQDNSTTTFSASHVTASLGIQPGILSSKRALAPLLQVGLGKNQAFTWAREHCAKAHLPFDDTPCTQDMLFAAEWTARTRGKARDMRSVFAGVLSELARRLEPLHSHLKQCAVAHRGKLLDIHVGFVLCIMFLIQWPHHELPSLLLKGHRIVGPLEATGVFQSCDACPPRLTVDELTGVDHRTSVIHDFKAKPLSQHAQFIIDSCAKEHERGWASGFLTEAEVNTRFPGGWCPTPSFVHEQACGKLRRIDDAKAGGSNAATSFSEKVTMGSAMQPAVYARLLLRLADQLQLDLKDDSLEHGNEDQPDAYRGLPVVLDHLACNVVMFKDLDANVLFQVVHALLFGFASSVMSYLPWAEFQQAFARRLLVLLWSIYVDDSNMVDFKSGKGSAQRLGKVGFELLRTPFAPHKSKPMTEANDHLGVVTDLSKAVSDRVISFWPRQSLCDKALGMIDTFRSSGKMTPAAASKYRGVVQFTAQPMAYRVGRAGMGPLKQRQYSDRPPWALSHALERSLNFHEMLFAAGVRRVVGIRGDHDPTLLIASDAQADTAPTGGYIALVNGVLSAAFCHFSPVLEAWGQEPGQLVTCIAVCECSMAITTLWDMREVVRGQRVLWLLDNSASLHSLIKGTSSNPHLGRAVELYHMFCYWFQVDVWFEFVDSDSNYSDGISRDLDKDPWCRKMGITPRECSVFPWMWECTLQEVWSSFQRAALEIEGS